MSETKASQFLMIFAGSIAEPAKIRVPATQKPATATRVATWRPLAASITLAEAARLTGGEPLVLAPGEPVFAGRRRE